MKPGLKRIEATLDQLGGQSGSPVGIAEDGADSSTGFNPDFNTEEDYLWGDPTSVAQPQTNPSQTNLSQTNPFQTKLRIQVEPFPLPNDKSDAAVSPIDPAPAKEQAVKDQAVREQAMKELARPATKEPIEAKLPIFPADSAVELAAVSSATDAEVPILSASQIPNLSLNRQAANPNLAIGLLKEIETLVRGWQKELEQTVQQIQAVYQDGPIVDGWLESYPPGESVIPPAASVSMLRHAEIEHLMEFIEQICQAEQFQITEDMRRTSYRLCGLDPDGKVWSRPCPSEQVPYVGLAIARYQKLRTLLVKKQSLENRLTSLVEALVNLHNQVNFS